MKLLERRHSTALELMGEKDEQLEELRADFNDLKQLYRVQVSELLGRLEKQQEQAQPTQ
jgi:TATA element modulatory factor